MNILYVNAYYMGGGAEKVMRHLYKNMREDNINSLCIVGRGLTESIEGVPVIYHRFGEKALTTFVGALLGNTLLSTRKAKRRIIDYIEENNIDIVHFHNLHSNYLGIEDIKEIRKKCKGVVITLHDMWTFTGMCTNSIECQKWCSDECRKCCGNLSTKASWFSNRLLECKKKVFSDKGIFFVTPSQWLFKMTQQSYLSCENVLTINNGIDLNKFIIHDQAEVREKYGLSIKKKVLLFLANGINNVFKGYSYLLDALNMIVNKEEYTLLIVGNRGNEKINSDYETCCMGYIDAEDVLSELYSAADVFILPSIADVYPYTPMESIASGTPVIAFDTGGIPEIVSDEVGWIVPFQDAKALAECIENVFEMPELLKEKKARCRSYAEEKFSMNKMIASYRELYKAIVRSDD